MPNAKVTLNGTTLIDLTSDSVTASALMSGVTAHDSSGALVTGTIAAKTSADITVAGPTVTVPGGVYSGSNSVTIPQASINSSFVWRVDPSIGFNSTTGVVTADFDQEYETFLVTQSGYADEMTIYLNPWGVSSYQIPTKSAATYTPSTTAQTIASGQYLTGAQTISGDTNLVAANIASGVSIFGVVGTHSGGVTPTGIISITSNGTYDVTNYASASVNIGATVSGAKLIVPEGMIGV